MADNRLIYQLTDGTPVSTDVVPYSGPASGDAFKGTVAELWAAGMQPQSNATIGTLNQVIAGPSSTAAEGYCVGNNNKLAGCAYAIGDQNQVCGASNPCSFAYGYLEQAWCGGYSYGTNNKTVGSISSVAGGGPAFSVGRNNVISGNNTYCAGNINEIGGGVFDVTNTGGNNYSITPASDISSYFQSGYIVLTYLVAGTTGNVRVSERLAYSNVAWNGTSNTFQLASLSMTPIASPLYQIYFDNCLDVTAFGFNNRIRNSSRTFVFGMQNTISSGNINVFVGYGFTETSLGGQTTYVGGDCNIRLQSTKLCYNTSMTVNPPAANTTSWAPDGNGNLSVQSANNAGNVFAINQTSNVDINSISNFSTLNGATNGQQFRLVNIGTSTITLHKDNASGTSGYRLTWQKAGGSIAVQQNHSVVFLYLSNLPLSGSTGGWVVLTDGIG
jgi:hypothetical protein